MLIIAVSSHRFSFFKYYYDSCFLLVPQLLLRLLRLLLLLLLAASAAALLIDECKPIPTSPPSIIKLLFHPTESLKLPIL